MTIKNRYPLLLIPELIDKLKDAKYFTKLDIRWGYNNVRIKDGNEWKAAFRTNQGLFKPLVMFFGLTNSPATFQTMMNHLLRELVLEGVVVVYLDDIMIFTKTLEEHQKVVKRVLAILCDNQLFLKPKKCEFHSMETEYLGLIVSEGKVQMDPVKVQGVADWPVPRNKRDIQAFLGFANFYQRFIRDFARHAKPLTKLTGKLDFEWNFNQQEAFDQIKRLITTAPILSIPIDNAPFRVETDASDYALGAVLSQLQDGHWKPIAFRSQALNNTKRNYEIYNKELLSVIESLKDWQQYLLGSAVPFEVWTDHRNLEYFRKPQDLNCQQARWITLLSDYNFTIYHKPGKMHVKADLLSRRPDLIPGGGKDN